MFPLPRSSPWKFPFLISMLLPVEGSIPSATIAREVVSASQGALVLQVLPERFTHSAVLLSIE